MLTDHQKYLADFNLQMAPTLGALTVPRLAEALMFDADPAELAAHREGAAAAVGATARRLLEHPALADAIASWPPEGARVMFVGDSVTTYLYSYARIIAAMVDLLRPGHRVTFANVAQAGCASTQAVELARVWSRGEMPDWLFVNIGLYDAMLFGESRAPLVDAGAYERNLGLLLDAFDTAPNLSVVLLAPTPVVTPVTGALPDFLAMGVAWDNEVIQAYGTAMARVAISRKGAYINLFDLLRRNSDPDDYLHDGLHPGLRGHEKIATRILRSMGETP